VNLSLDAVPRGIDLEEVGDYLRALSGVAEVHDLHIWAMSTTETAMTAHLVRSDASGDGPLLSQIAHDMRKHFGIGHVTVQCEPAETARVCELRSDCVV
jgi:cobalt-zinc-cadmium efflux system protein